MLIKNKAKFLFLTLTEDNVKKTIEFVFVIWDIVVHQVSSDDLTETTQDLKIIDANYDVRILASNQNKIKITHSNLIFFCLFLFIPEIQYKEHWYSKRNKR
jgi:hypothetical protein